MYVCPRCSQMQRNRSLARLYAKMCVNFVILDGRGTFAVCLCSETVALCEINLLVISVWAKCSRMDEWMDKWWGGLAGS